MKRRIARAGAVVLYYVVLAAHFIESPRCFFAFLRHGVVRRWHWMQARSVATKAVMTPVEVLAAALREAGKL